MKKKFIIMGTGNRGIGCFGKGLRDIGGKGRPEFPQHAEIVALVDSNLTRGKKAAAELQLPDLPVYKTIEEAKHLNADWCVITTPDRTHCEQVCRTLRIGVNCLVDKPLATSSQECAEIIDCMKETGKDVIVGHNARYTSHALKTAQMIRDGVIGEVLTGEVVEVLDHSHGGDYFHRWHSNFENTAGMLAHKGCHFFDVINWQLDDEPISVVAQGSRKYYKPRPDLDHAERCLDCNLKTSCTHYNNLDKWDGIYRRLYIEAEGEDGYIRDLCVFSDRHTINDNEQLIINYKKGTTITFSMVCYGTREFSYFQYQGTKGRIELGTTAAGEGYFRLIHSDGTVENLERQKGEGEHGHGGNDKRLMAHVLGIQDLDPMFRAFPIDAKKAVDIADMANRSIARGGVLVTLDEVGKDFPPPPPQSK